MSTTEGQQRASRSFALAAFSFVARCEKRRVGALRSEIVSLSASPSRARSPAWRNLIGHA